MSEADVVLFLHNHLYQPEHELKEQLSAGISWGCEDTLVNIDLPATDQPYNWNNAAFYVAVWL